MVFSSQFAAWAGAKEPKTPKAIKTATVRDRMQRDTRTMTELLPAHDPEKACPGLDPVWHTGFRTRPCARTTGRLYHSFFPPQPIRTQLCGHLDSGAKRGSTAPYAYADLVLVETGARQPRSLSNAFRDAGSRPVCS